MCKKIFYIKKLEFKAPRSSFKVPALAMPNEDDRVSVQKRVWVSEWVVTSFQESQNPSRSGNCCFSTGEEFSSTKSNQTKVDEAMWSSNKQNKNMKLLDVPEKTSFVTNLSLRSQSTSLGMVKTENLKLDFKAKSIGIHLFWFEGIFRCYRDTKT